MQIGMKRESCVNQEQYPLLYVLHASCMKKSRASSHCLLRWEGAPDENKSEDLPGCIFHEGFGKKAT
jgi:hypothetical protein